MTTIERALKRILDEEGYFGFDPYYADIRKACLDNARAALAAHESQQKPKKNIQQPVAWRYRYHPNGEWHLADESAKGSLSMTGAGDTFEEQPLYTKDQTP